MSHKITEYDVVLSNQGTEWHKLAKHHPNLVLGDILKVWGNVEAVPALHGDLLIPDTQTILVNDRPVTTVGDRYNPTNTHAVMDAVAEILGLDDRFCLTTIGTVDNQRDAFACISLGDSIAIGRNDEIRPYFTIIDNRCGKRKLMIGENATRPVCANTVAVGRYELKDSACRHTAGLDIFVSAIVDEFKAKLAAREEMESNIHRLVDTRWNDDTKRAYLDKFAPARPKVGAKRVSQGHDNAMLSMESRIARESAETGIAADSAWIIYNSATGYQQHDSRIKGDRLAARWNGSIASKSEEAWTEALALC